jgi:hypothetical protein
MKQNLFTLVALGVIGFGGFAVAALGGFAVGRAQDATLGGRGRCRGDRFALERFTKPLNLTADQQTKVQPLIDQAQPQLTAIRKGATEKTHAIIDETMTQIRPLLTLDQQAKFDDLQEMRQDMRSAKQRLRDAMGD